MNGMNAALEVRALHDSAREVARIGGRATLDWFATGNIAVEQKSDDSPVTIADRNTETIMREEIGRRFPDHKVIGEEHGGTISGTGTEWILDPIDGTKTFIRGVPLYTTLVAVLRDGVPLAGVVYAPATGELASAFLGGGTWNERGQQVRVSPVTTLEKAWYGTTDPADFQRRSPEFARTLLSRCAAARTWADAYGYMLLARGAIDIMIDPILSPWDVAPLGLIVREAGGVFTDLQGIAQPLGESALACATNELHGAIMEILRETSHGTVR